jgi:hypothetical protein
MGRKSTQKGRTSTPHISRKEREKKKEMRKDSTAQLEREANHHGMEWKE